MKKKIVKLFLQLFVAVLFIVMAAYLILSAFGYRIDLVNINLVKTSIIDVNNKLDDINLYLNDELIHDKTPYQIKNLIPGKYNLLVEKENYKNWEKTVLVQEDIVTIIEDILLIPLDLEKYTNIVEILFDYDELIFNHNYFIFINYDLQQINTYSLLEDEMFLKEINVDFDMSNENLYLVNTNYIVFQNKENIILFNIEEEIYIEIKIPDEFDKFKIAYQNIFHGFYLNDGNLYTTEISEDGTFKKVTLLSEDIDEFYLSESLYTIFLLIDNNLYYFENDELFLIDENVSTSPIVSPGRDEILYITADNKLILNDFKLKKREILTQFSKPIQNIYWFNDGKHIHIQSEDTVTLCDMDFVNCNNILYFNESQNIVISPYSPKVLTITDDKIKVLDFISSLSTPLISF